MALRLVLESRKMSVSYPQRRMKIGYARAGRIMDMMEENRIVGPDAGSKPLDLLVDPADYLANMREQLAVKPSSAIRVLESYLSPESKSSISFRTVQLCVFDPLRLRAAV
jgi:hypothetical protein